jgi:hypothetical protein
MLYLSFICFLATIGGFSQIIVDMNDMPLAGDTLRVSVAVNVPIGFDQGGADTLWNFTNLEPLNQKIDSFMSVSLTPPAYWLYFIPGIETNLASPRTSGLIPGIPITDAFNFYNKTTGAFYDLGYALTVQGIPLPLKYDKPDVYYKLPFTYGDQWTSESALALSIPTFAYYGSSRSRTSKVDGWGNISTPFGTFETVRVKSEITQFDSIFIDSLGIGFGINRLITEYKWLGKSQGIPLLTIIKEGPSVSASYRDIPRMPVVPLTMDLGPDTTVVAGTTMDIKASLKGGTPPYNILWNTMDSGRVITVTVDTTTTFVAICIDATFDIISASKTINTINPGIQERAAALLRIRPNPVADLLTVATPAGTGKVVLTILTPQGKTMRTVEVEPGSDGICSVDVSGLTPGFYLMRVLSGSKTWAGKFVKK